MEELIIHCIQCGTEFVYSVDDQMRYREMNFDDPKRCKSCRKKKSKRIDSADKRVNLRKKRGPYEPE
ncbi:MAG: zinc-ribbon domain containing protein [Deltaproteobacteria bacterium]|nr:zinc-ribbon domain containing protein [Deltaproteobacteria bacterium]